MFLLALLYFIYMRKSAVMYVRNFYLCFMSINICPMMFLLNLSSLIYVSIKTCPTMFVLNLTSLIYKSISTCPIMCLLNLSFLIYRSISTTIIILKLSSLNYTSTCGVVIVLKLLSSHRKLLYSMKQRYAPYGIFLWNFWFSGPPAFSYLGEISLRRCFVISYVYKPQTQCSQKSTV